MKRLRSQYDDDLLSAGMITNTQEDCSTEAGMTMAQHIPALNMMRQSFLSSLHDFPNSSNHEQMHNYVPLVPSIMIKPDSEHGTEVIKLKQEIYEKSNENEKLILDLKQAKV